MVVFAIHWNASQSDKRFTLHGNKKLLDMVYGLHGVRCWFFGRVLRFKVLLVYAKSIKAIGFTL